MATMAPAEEDLQPDTRTFLSTGENASAAARVGHVNVVSPPE